MGTTAEKILKEALNLPAKERAAVAEELLSSLDKPDPASVLQHCGVESFAYGKMSDGTPTVAVNVNCLAGVDPRTLKSQHVDGKSF